MWQPTASIANLHRRSELLARIRQFFAERGVIEVETPILSQFTVTNPYIQSFETPVSFSKTQSNTYYLQTSPEYAMKRLLAADCGSIYQITKAFRKEEQGQRHNPEFSLLEWYRVGFDHHQLMDEVEALLIHLLKLPRANRYSYEQAFIQHLQINPHLASMEELMSCCSQHHIDVVGEKIDDRNIWLDLLMSHVIEPNLASDRPTIIYHFPASQAALAKTNYDEKGIHIAERFEVYLGGMELANGFHELSNATEQGHRFAEENRQRVKSNLKTVPIDNNLLAALEHGLPACAGVALGIDRLMMFALNAKSIDEVISFTFDRA